MLITHKFLKIFPIWSFVIHSKWCHDMFKKHLSLKILECSLKTYCIYFLSYSDLKEELKFRKRKNEH